MHKAQCTRHKAQVGADTIRPKEERKKKKEKRRMVGGMLGAHARPSVTS